MISSRIALAIAISVYAVPAFAADAALGVAAHAGDDDLTIMIVVVRLFRSARLRLCRLGRCVGGESGNGVQGNGNGECDPG